MTAILSKYVMKNFNYEYDKLYNEIMKMTHFLTMTKYKYCALMFIDNTEYLIKEHNFYSNFIQNLAEYINYANKLDLDEIDKTLVNEAIRTQIKKLTIKQKEILNNLVDIEIC